jgi:PhoPQ-activated pathogenicity-related protein
MKATILLGALLVASCASKGPAGPVEVRTATIAGQSLSIALSYEVVKPREVTLILRLRTSAIEASDRLVADVMIKGFDLAEGSPRWSGFVPPRQPQTHRVVLAIPEDINHAKATVVLKDSSSSQVLLSEELSFSVSDSGKISAD